MKQLANREIMPGNLKAAELENSSKTPRILTGIRRALQKWAGMECPWSAVPSKFVESKDSVSQTDP